MKKVLRLYLDSPSCLGGDKELDFVLRDKRGHVLRRGRARPDALVAQRLATALELVLPADMATTTLIRIPAVSAARRPAVVASAVEPLCLSPLEQVWVTCGPRQENGLAPVAWAERASLQAVGDQARRTLLPLAGIYAWSPRHAGDRAGQESRVELPDCSLLMPQMDAGQASAVGVKTCLWGLGLLVAWGLVWQQQARSLSQEVKQLKTQMEQSLRQALPYVPVVVAPLVQARQHRDALLGEQMAEPDLFDRVLMASAAQWPALEGRVRALSFKDGELSLTVASEAGLEPPAADSGLQLLAGDSPREWRVQIRKTIEAGGQS